MGVSKPAVKKATASTELVLGQAAQQISKAVNELVSATNTITKLSEQAEALTLLVANKEDAITALDIQFSEKERQLNVDLDLSFKSNTDKVVTTYLASVNRTSIPTSELENLRNELTEIKSNVTSSVKQQVSEVVTGIKSEYENSIKLIQSENRAVAAQNEAKLGSLESQNKFLEEQVTKLYKQLDSEREAGVQRAQASAVGSINLGDSTRNK